MTRAEWDALSPRERDALVAEKVMGAVWEHEPKWPGGPADYMNPPKGKRERGLWAERRCADGRVIYSAGLPRFTRSWGAMREVVGMMEGVGFWCVLKSPFRLGLDWHAGFNPHDTTGWNGRPDHAGDAPTAPEAVCIAALIALGHMEEP